MTSESNNLLTEQITRKESLISVLEDIQSKYGYLPKDELINLSQDSGRSLVDIYGVATFYRSFSLEPRGKHLVSVCLGTACHIRGGQKVAEEFERQLEISCGSTSDDREYSLETVACLGACALGPIVLVDGQYFSKVSISHVKKIIKKTKDGLNHQKHEIKADHRIFPVEVSCSHCNHSLMDSDMMVDGYPSIWVTISSGRKHGWLRLSSLYGSYHTISDFDIQQDAIINLFCPYCHTDLSGSKNCMICDAPMVSMIVRGGGIVQICSRHGCEGHMLDISGINV